MTSRPTRHPRRRRASSARAAGCSCSRSTPRSAASSSIRSRTPRCRRRWTISTTADARAAREETELEIRLAGDFIFVNATRLRLELDNYASFSHILTMLRAFEIGVLRVHCAGNRREWQALLSILLSLSERSEPERPLRRAGRAAGRRRRSQGLEIERATPEHDPTPSRREERPSAPTRRASRSPRT